MARRVYVELAVGLTTLWGDIVSEHREKVRAVEVHGHLAITPAYKAKGFRVTHIPTGMKLPKDYRKVETARRDIQRILPLTDWSFTDSSAMTKAVRNRIRKAIGIGG